MRQWLADLLVSAFSKGGGRRRKARIRREGVLSYLFPFPDVDRSIRPLFPGGYSNETQVWCKIPTLVSFSDHHWNGSGTEHICLYITDVAS